MSTTFILGLALGCGPDGVVGSSTDASSGTGSGSETSVADPDLPPDETGESESESDSETGGESPGFCCEVFGENEPVCWPADNPDQCSGQSEWCPSVDGEPACEGPACEPGSLGCACSLRDLDGNGVVPPGGECLALLMCVDGTCVPVDVDFGPGNITFPEVDDFGGCFMDADGPGLLTVVHPAYYGTPAWFEDFVPAEVPPECDPLLSWSSVECFTGPNDLQCFGEHVDALDIVIPISCAPTGEGLLLLPFIRNCDPSLEAAQALLGPVTCGEANRACMQTLDGAEVYTMPACSVL